MWNCFWMIDVTYYIKINKENKQRAWLINLTFNQQQQEKYEEMKWWKKSIRSIIENKNKKTKKYWKMFMLMSFLTITLNDK